MKAKLEFDLPDDNTNFRCAVAGVEMALAFHEILQVQLRNWIKYDSHDFTTPAEALEGVQDFIYRELESRGIDLDYFME